MQVYAPVANAIEVDQFYEDLEDLLEHLKKMFNSSLGIGMQT